MQNATHQEAATAIAQYQAELIVYGCTLAQLNQMLEREPLAELVLNMTSKACKAIEAGKDEEAKQAANCVTYLTYRAKTFQA